MELQLSASAAERSRSGKSRSRITAPSGVTNRFLPSAGSSVTPDSVLSGVFSSHNGSRPGLKITGRDTRGNRIRSSAVQENQREKETPPYHEKAEICSRPPARPHHGPGRRERRQGFFQSGYNEIFAAGCNAMPGTQYVMEDRRPQQRQSPDRKRGALRRAE